MAPGNPKALPGPRPRAVTLDCWQTLLVEVDPTPARATRRNALRALAQDFGRTLSDRGAQEILDVGWQRHTRMWQAHRAVGAHDIAGWCLERLGLPGEEASHKKAQLAQAFAEASLASDIQPLEGAGKTLDLLADAGIATALVCDTGFTPGPVLRRILERTGLLSGLGIQVFSDEVGVPKPEAAIFEAALEGLGVEARWAVHVGDLKRTDVAGARALGMRSIRIRQTHDDTSNHPEADRVVASHAALQELLEATLES